MIQTARKKSNLRAGGTGDGAGLEFYFENRTDLKRHQLGVWFLHVLLRLEPIIEQLSEHAAEGSPEEARTLTHEAYHWLSGAVAFLDQTSWDEGTVALASKVSLLDPPALTIKADATRAQRSTQDNEAHAPLVDSRTVDIAGSAMGDSQQLKDRTAKYLAGRTSGAK